MVHYGLGDLQGFSLPQNTVLGHYLRIWIYEDFRSADLETSLVFPFSPLSICLSSSSVDGSHLGWITVHCLSRIH